MLTWREYPFVRIFIPFASGIATALLWHPSVSATWVYAALALSFGATLWAAALSSHFRLRWLFGAPLSITLFVLGFSWVNANNEWYQPHHFRHVLDDRKSQLVIGEIVDITERPRFNRLKIAVKRCGTSVDSLELTSGSLLVYCRRDSSENASSEAFALGDLIATNVSVRAVEPPENPLAFDFQRYWALQNVYFQGFINKTDVKLLQRATSASLSLWIRRWQIYLVAKLKKHLPTADEFAVGSALILGYKDYVTDEVRNAYVETGAMHILAVSGMHILLIFKGFEWLLSFYKSGNRRYRWAKTVFLLLLVWLFTLLTGAGASVVRAATMSSFLAVGQALNRRVNTYNVLAGSAFFLLLWQPNWLLDVGFQLSYLAVVGIVFFYPRVQKMVVVEKWYLRWVWESVAVGLAAQLVVTPISLYYFHQFPTYFWLSGLLAIPASTVALYAGIGVFLLDWLPGVGFLLGKILHVAVWLMNQSIFFVQNLPLSIISGLSISVVGLVATYGILFGLARAVVVRKLRVMFYPLSILAALTLFSAFKSLTESPKRQFLVYHVANGTYLEMIDAGGAWRFVSAVDSSKIQFASANYHASLGIQNASLHGLDTVVDKASLRYHHGFFQFGKRRGLLIRGENLGKLDIPLDYVVVGKSPRVTMAALRNQFKFQKIIFDTSNKPWLVDRWKRECTTLGIAYHDVALEGAFIDQF